MDERVVVYASVGDVMNEKLGTFVIVQGVNTTVIVMFVL